LCVILWKWAEGTNQRPQEWWQTGKRASGFDMELLGLNLKRKGERGPSAFINVKHVGTPNEANSGGETKRCLVKNRKSLTEQVWDDYLAI